MAKNRDYLTELRRLLERKPDEEWFEDIRHVLGELSGSEKVDWQTTLDYLLRLQPSPELWDAICKLFTSWPESPVRTRAMVAADKRLAHWDPMLRFISANKWTFYDGGKMALWDFP